MNHAERILLGAMIGLLLCSAAAMWWTTSLAVPSSSGQTAVERERIKRERARRGRGDGCQPGCDCSDCLQLDCDCAEHTGRGPAMADGCDCGDLPCGLDGCDCVDLPCDCATVSKDHAAARTCRPGLGLIGWAVGSAPLLIPPALMLGWRWRLRRRSPPDP